MFNTKIQVFYSYEGYDILNGEHLNYCGDGIITIKKPIWVKWDYIKTYDFIMSEIKKKLRNENASIHILQFHKL
ncbi:hypothetical protein B6S12_09765 [Helicobacter valdiviensis]|uniref:Uncharacterized protein n=1 Tax=Helicobacter valdiviensis TaxID=1458358 RepID=A0A2W6NEC7_9HELI|nr:hypothetical protein [Helicobacter valdiviensis]PZT47310.1 hypothetical protein B6S12_09765 [Helicobacter valdiviensis]